jgi:hypothetical protein
LRCSVLTATALTYHTGCRTPNRQGFPLSKMGNSSVTPTVVQLSIQAGCRKAIGE